MRATQRHSMKRWEWVEFRILGPIEISDGAHTLETRWSEGTDAAGLPGTLREPCHLDGPAQRRVCGPGSARRPHSETTLASISPGCAGRSAPGRGRSSPIGSGTSSRSHQPSWMPNRFVAMADSARAELAAGHPEAAAAGLRDALRCGARPCPTVADQAFAEQRLPGWKKHGLSALEDRITADLGCALRAGRSDGGPLRRRWHGWSSSPRCPIRTSPCPRFAAALTAQLRDREALLILDNCEHLLEPGRGGPRRATAGLPPRYESCVDQPGQAPGGWRGQLAGPRRDRPPRRENETRPRLRAVRVGPSVLRPSRADPAGLRAHRG